MISGGMAGGSFAIIIYYAFYLLTVYTIVDTLLPYYMYMQVVNIESISGCEDMILRILYEYFKIYPDDYFYNEMSWYYDKNDIIKIYESSSWDDWCYVKNQKNING